MALAIIPAGPDARYDPVGTGPAAARRWHFVCARSFASLGAGSCSAHAYRDRCRLKVPLWRFVQSSVAGVPLGTVRASCMGAGLAAWIGMSARLLTSRDGDPLPYLERCKSSTKLRFRRRFEAVSPGMRC